MSALVLGIDSGLNGAFAWMKDGAIVHTLLTGTMVKNGKLGDLSPIAWFPVPCRDAVAYIEQPVRMRGKGEQGIETAFINTGRIEERLRVAGYRIVRVLPKTWQGDLLDLARFDVRTEVACKPRLAEGWKLRKSTREGHRVWLLSNSKGAWTYPMGGFGIDRETLLKTITLNDETSSAVTASKTTISHDTKAASLAYVRAHFPDLNLIPPRARNPHDGLADAVCIAVWGSRQIKETP